MARRTETKVNPLAKQWEKVQEGCKKGNIEEMMYAMRDYFSIDAARSEHPIVKSLLESCAESAGVIAFEYYASLK